MNRIASIGLIAIAMIAAALWLFGGGDDTPSVVTATERVDAVDAPAPPLVATDEGAPRGAAEPETPADSPTERTAVAASSDPDARGDLTVKVVDEAERPVAGADVTFWALRSKQSPASHSVWNGEAPRGKTDARGEVTMWFPVWVRERHETSVVTVRVDHPHFVSKDQDIRIESGEHRIMVEHGTFVTVSGWIGSPDNMVMDVAPRATDDSRVRDDDWLRSPGSKPSTHKMAEGHHALYLTHDAGGERYYSDVVDFDLQKGDSRDFHLELRKAYRLRGALDPSVPRPVQNGVVVLNLFIVRGPARTSREFTAKVAADGTFELAPLPSGSGQIIARCGGWVSDEELPDIPPEDEGGSVPQFGPQPVEVRGDVENFVLHMRRAATLVATVRDPDGDPVSGARVVLWPNVFWGHGYSSFFFGEVYEAFTDARGVATVRDLPPGDQGYLVSAEGLEMPLRDQGDEPPARRGKIDLRSGETQEVEVRLVRKP